MKIKFKTLQQGEKDKFSEHLATAEWIFKFVGWFVLIGTLKYAGQATGHAAFTFWALALTLEIGWLALSFVNHRVEIELIAREGKRRGLRTAVNIIFAGLISWLAWQAATWVVNDVAREIVEFNKSSKAAPQPPTAPVAPRPER